MGDILVQIKESASAPQRNAALEDMDSDLLQDQESVSAPEQRVPSPVEPYSTPEYTADDVIQDKKRTSSSEISDLE